MGLYDKYFIEYDKEKWRWPNERRPVMARMEDAVAKGSHFYLVHWVLPPRKRDDESEIQTIQASAAPGPMDHPMSGHPPHIHRDAELLFHIGTNPDDPMDLGAEVQMYMGPEMERHVFNRTTCIYIPPNFIHAPWMPLKTERPWIFIEVNQGPSHTEKSFRQLLPKELRERTDWSKRWLDEGY